MVIACPAEQLACAASVFKAPSSSRTLLRMRLAISYWPRPPADQSAPLPRLAAAGSRARLEIRRVDRHRQIPQPSRDFSRGSSPSTSFG
jgi:hypothetical protein